jgi:hypothetical protein
MIRACRAESAADALGMNAILYRLDSFRLGMSVVKER